MRLRLELGVGVTITTVAFRGLHIRPAGLPRGREARHDPVIWTDPVIATWPVCQQDLPS